MIPPYTHCIHFGRYAGEALAGAQGEASHEKEGLMDVYDEQLQGKSQLICQLQELVDQTHQEHSQVSTRVST